jgi:hypothetical protein
VALPLLHVSVSRLGWKLTHLTRVLQLDSEEEEFRAAADQIRAKKATIKKLSQDRNKLKNRPVIPRKHQSRTLSQLSTTLRSVGLDPSRIEERARLLAKARGVGVVDGSKPRGVAIPGEKQGKRSMRARMEAEAEEMMAAAEGEGMEVDDDDDERSGKRGGAVAGRGTRNPKSNRAADGLTQEVSARAFSSTLLMQILTVPSPQPTAIREVQRAPQLCPATPQLPRKRWRGRPTHRYLPTEVAPCGQAESWKDRLPLIWRWPSRSFSFFFTLCACLSSHSSFGLSPPSLTHPLSFTALFRHSSSCVMTLDLSLPALV